MKSRTTKNKISKQKHWGNHISCWRKSGLTQRQYCLKQSIALSTFTYWIRKSAKDSAKPNPPRFYPLTVKPTSTAPDQQKSHAGIRLSLCNEKFIVDLEKDFSETTLKRLIVMLEMI